MGKVKNQIRKSSSWLMAKHRGEHGTKHDLKWLDLLREEAEDEITHNDLFALLESYDGDCLDIELKNRRQRRSFMQDPVLYLTKKLNSSKVNLKNVSARDLALFNRAKFN